MENKKQTDLMIALQDKEQAVAVFTGERLDEFLKTIQDDAMNFIADVSTNQGRQTIASKAHSIAKNKTKIDAIGKELVGDWKRKAKLVDESRKKARDFLDELKETVRKPLTEWEAAEAARIQAAKDLAELTEAWNEAIKEDTIFEREKEIERKEAKLKAQEEARLEKERLEKEKIDRIEHERQIAEQAKIQAEKEALEKIEAEKKARIEAELKAEQDKIEAEARRQKEIEDAKIKAEMEKQAAIEKERDAVRQKEIAKQEAERKEREIAEKKAANLEHRRKINKEALVSFVKEGFQEKEAKEIIRLIAANLIKNITINY